MTNDRFDQDKLQKDYRKAFKRNPERERWLRVGFSAVAIIGLKAAEQDIFLRQLLQDQFADVPAGMPPPDATTDAWACAAVKLLLRALVDDGSDGNRMRVIKEMAFEAMQPAALRSNARIEGQQARFSANAEHCEMTVGASHAKRNNTEKH